MTTELTNLAQDLVVFSIVMALQIGLVLLLRKPVKSWLGAQACYRLWLLPLLWLPCYWAGPKLLALLSSLLYTDSYNANQSALQQFLQLELLPFDFSTDAAG